jgi:hypothetical protein
MFSLPIFKRSSPAMPGSEQTLSGEMSLFPALPVAARLSSAAPMPVHATGPAAPLPGAGELHITGSLDRFHTLVRQYRADRVYLDLLELTSNDADQQDASYYVLLSASRHGTDILARLTYQGERGTGRAHSLKSAQTYLNVLRSRFLFLGYATSDGLASARLARELQSPPPQA